MTEGIKFRLVQEGDRRSSCLLVQGHWSWQTVCKQMRCTVYLSHYPTNMIKELCNTLLKIPHCKTFCTSFVLTSLGFQHATPIKRNAPFPEYQYRSPPTTFPWLSLCTEWDAPFPEPSFRCLSESPVEEPSLQVPFAQLQYRSVLFSEPSFTWFSRNRFQCLYRTSVCVT